MLEKWNEEESATETKSTERIFCEDREDTLLKRSPFHAVTMPPAEPTASTASK